MSGTRSSAWLIVLLPVLFVFPTGCPAGGGGRGGPCTDTSQCRLGQECVDQICMDEIPCTEAGQCDMARPYCRADLGKCVAACTPACDGRCCGQDGCGGTCADRCGATGQTCDGATCACAGTCQPLSCADQGVECGAWSDGCGGALQCPACPNGLACNSQGQCVSDCTPLACAQVGYACGIWPGQDGCGGDLQCPACPNGQSCNGLGQCVAGCTPQSCAAAGVDCGVWPGQDGCGGDLQCPACPTGQECDAGGHCADICEPLTCQDLGLACGDHAAADGCGGDLSCGACDAHSACTPAGQCETICDLDRLENDQLIDLNLDTVTVSGSITLNGGVMPDDPDQNDDRGWVIFLDKQTGSSTWMTVDPAGPATFAGPLFAGSYDVYFETNSYQDNPAIPDGKTLIARDLDCGSDRQLAWDLSVVTVSASLTINGAVMPDDPDANDDRGYLVFSDRDAASSTWVAVGPAGPATLSAQLFAGHYSLDFETNSYQDNPAIPDGRFRLEEELNLDQSLQTSWDLPVFRLSGQIRLNGGVMPDDPDQNDARGSLVAVDQATGSATWINIGPAGPATYDAPLFGGMKTLRFETNSYQDNPAIPDGKALLETDYDLSANGSLDFDLAVVNLSGQVRLNGAVMPDDPDQNDDRGYVLLRQQATMTDTWVPVGPAGPASYSTTLFAGEYAVFFETNSYQDNPAIPDGRTRLLETLDLSSDQTRDWNLQVIDLSGRLTINGGAMPDDPDQNDDRGYLLFKDRSTASTSWIPIGPAGPADWSSRLFAGAYDVSFETNSYQDNASIPAGRTSIASRLDCQTSQQFAWDLSAITISGTVSHNHGLMADDQDANDDRGYVKFIDANTGRSAWATVAPAGQAAYSLRLWAGSYSIQWQTNSYAEIDLPESEVRLLRGCLASGSCEADPADLSGVWDLTFLNTAWNPNGAMTLDLTQDGQSLQGSYQSEQWYIGSGQISMGSVQGASVSFHVDFAQTGDVALSGTVANGCFMTGHAVVSGGLDSDWLAERRQP